MVFPGLPRPAPCALLLALLAGLPPRFEMAWLEAPLPPLLASTPPLPLEVEVAVAPGRVLNRPPSNACCCCFLLPTPLPDTAAPEKLNGCAAEVAIVDGDAGKGPGMAAPVAEIPSSSCCRGDEAVEASDGFDEAPGVKPEDGEAFGTFPLLLPLPPAWLLDDTGSA